MNSATKKPGSIVEAVRGAALDAVIFDMDGVVMRTAHLHARAWKSLFDAFLSARAERSGGSFEPFDLERDYLDHVDGRPRLDGVRGFLSARGIELAQGHPGDAPEAETMHGLARRKDALFDAALRAEGVQLYDSTMALIHELRARGIRIGLQTSSRHGHELLRRLGIEEFFDARVDGADAEHLGLPGKPEPHTFLYCAERLRALTTRTAVVEDAVSGVTAARLCAFALVVGVDRGGNRDALVAAGADCVVSDLAEMSVDAMFAQCRTRRHRERAWRVEQEGFALASEHGVESLFTVANGYMGVRGALDTPLPSSHADLFIAGVYDRKHPERPYSEHEFMDVGRGEYPYSELVSLPFPFRVELSTAGRRLDFEGDRWRHHRRELEMREAILHRESVFELDDGSELHVRSRRCASAADPHLLLQDVSLWRTRTSTGEGSRRRSGPHIEIDFSLSDPDLAANHPHLIPLEAEVPEDGIELHRFTTHASGIEIALASRTVRLGDNGNRIRWWIESDTMQQCGFRRAVAVYTTRDTDDPATAACARVRRLGAADYEVAVAAHRKHWYARWKRADVRVRPRPGVEQALRFQAYHLMASAGRDPRVSVGARALSGRAYEGHIFWDVEIFMLAFHIHTQPAVARSLLGYRHWTLDGARRRARESGHAGANFAWESTVTGEDVTPRNIRLRTTGREIPIYTGTQQIHVTADVAFGVWRYWEATGDEAFLREHGTEILVETARFWESRSVPGEDGLRHILEVVGPDEYHHSVDDNAYTNWLARLNLERAAMVFDWLTTVDSQAASALAERLALGEEEPDAWRDTAAGLYCPQPGEDGVIEQFAGFFALQDYPLAEEERFRAPVDRLFDWDRINRLKLIKQADVLMLMFLLPEEFSDEVVAANYDYYEPMTDHGSSLSPAIHAAIAARIGRHADAQRYFEQGLWLDLSNVMGNSALGVHPACMGATWQALVFGFLGVRFTDEGPRADPKAVERLPAKWQEVALELAWRGRHHALKVKR